MDWFFSPFFVIRPFDKNELPSSFLYALRVVCQLHRGIL